MKNYKSQIYFRGEMIDVEWSQTPQGKINAINVVSPSLSWLSLDFDFRDALYRRSQQIEEAKKYVSSGRFAL